MKIMLFISDLIIPITFITIILYGYSKKLNIYEAFIEGAKEGLSTVLYIMPTLIGLMIAVGVMRASGALTIFTNLIEPFTYMIGYPKEAVSLTLMRLVSSSAATGILLDIFKNYGPDSFTGRFVSIMMSCTETVFYTMSIYFMSIKITKTRYTLAGALIANAAGVIFSLYLTNRLFG